MGSTQGSKLAWVSLVTVCKLLKHSSPQFPHLRTEDASHAASQAEDRTGGRCVKPQTGPGPVFGEPHPHSLHLQSLRLGDLAPADAPLAVAGEKRERSLLAGKMLTQHFP